MLQSLIYYFYTLLILCSPVGLTPFQNQCWRNGTQGLSCGSGWGLVKGLGVGERSPRAAAAEASSGWLWKGENFCSKGPTGMSKRLCQPALLYGVVDVAAEGPAKKPSPRLEASVPAVVASSVRSRTDSKLAGRNVVQPLERGDVPRGTGTAPRALS